MSHPDIRNELHNAPAEPLLPIEKKLIGWSLGTGIALLVVGLLSFNRCIIGLGDKFGCMEPYKLLRGLFNRARYGDKLIFSSSPDHFKGKRIFNGVNKFYRTCPVA